MYAGCLALVAATDILATAAICHGPDPNAATYISYNNNANIRHTHYQCCRINDARTHDNAHHHHYHHHHHHGGSHAWFVVYATTLVCS